jgi:hypothetical protein
VSDLLSTHLYREVREAAFFRVLTGRNAPTYVDVLDALDRESSARADGIDRHEAIEIICDVLGKHPEYQIEEDEPPAPKPSPSPGEAAPNTAPNTALSAAPSAAPNAALRELARRALDYLTRCRWLEEPPRKDWRRRLYFDAHGATLIATLRQIARPGAVVFTDKLVAVCAMLANEEQLTEQPLQTVEACLDNTRAGIGELRTMQKSVQRLTRAQLDQDTLRGNLSLVFNEYADQIGHGAYAELVRSRLPIRLPQAVRRIGERLFNDGAAMAEMTNEQLRRCPGMSADSAVIAVRLRLDELVYLIELVLPMADEIDRRTADFTRRSLARFRYLQDVTGERRSEIGAFFQQVNHHLQGRRLSSPWTLPELPSLRLPETRIPAGQDTLYTPHARSVAGVQHAMDEEVTDADRTEGLRDMERALKESLSVRRANAFVGLLPGGKGERVSSADLPIADEAHLTELIAVLLHAESAEARYRLEPARVSAEDKEPPLDALPGARVEHFDLIKK